MLLSAGVERELVTKTFECIETERAKAIATAARLFYCPNDGQRPIAPFQFSDELSIMTRRLWGLVAAAGDVLGEDGGALNAGVLQLTNDIATAMERLSEAFQAENWLERQQESQQ
ncbi:Hypothetical protein BN69_2767 [Methylocystis sp. SC2]|nr:Hypothetical protein BN69_2767 [Methylocystis sp. SC2]